MVVWLHQEHTEVIGIELIGRRVDPTNVSEDTFLRIGLLFQRYKIVVGESHCMHLENVMKKTSNKSYVISLSRLKAFS